jgi:hypothetical protein
LGGGGGQAGEMTQALYAHMNNKTIKIKINYYQEKKRMCELCIVLQITPKLSGLK